MTFNALGTGTGTGTVSGTSALSYTTVGLVTTVGATRRAVTVRLLEALPAGVSGNVSFTPDTGNGTSTGTLTLSTTAQVLVDLISNDVSQSAKALNYTFSTTKGFTDVTLKIEYVLIDL
ncbi:hypothetical protein [Deinococcus deserti]|uniref:hypothetical protein n=1 Tax=Deinococcus deserti TaxID=310783 RepID=UPI00019950FC|nr:hypothetical protein [Deinococcus deserti]